MESGANTSSSVEYDYALGPGLIMVIKSLRGVGRARERLFNVQIAERQWRIVGIDTSQAQYKSKVNFTCILHSMSVALCITYERVQVCKTFLLVIWKIKKMTH